MSDTDSIAVGLRCDGCGAALKPKALFCTGCGTRVPEGAHPDDPGSDAPGTCASCDAVLKPNAEFCTACGTAVAASAIDLTVDGADTETAPGDAPPTTVSPADRVSPAASRAILGSVSGGMGSYVGSARTDANGAGKPPEVSASATAKGDQRKKRLLIMAVAAVVVGLLIGIGAVVANQIDSGSELHAGSGDSGHVDDPDAPGGEDGPSGSSGTSGSANTKDQDKDQDKDTKSGDDSAKTSSTDAPGSTAGGDDGSTDDGSSSSGTSGGSTGSSTSGSTGSGGGGSSGSTGGSGGGGGGSHGTTPSTGGTVAAPKPAKLSVTHGALNFTTAGRSGVFYVKNAGGTTMRWTATAPTVPGMTISSRGGTLAAGQTTKVTLTWNRWLASDSDVEEGSWSTEVVVDAGSAGRHTITNITADNMQGDAFKNAKIRTCANQSGSLCRSGSVLEIKLRRQAHGFRGAFPEQVQYQINGTAGFSGWQHVNAYRQNTYPDTAFNLEVHRSFRAGTLIELKVLDEHGNFFEVSGTISW